MNKIKFTIAAMLCLTLLLPLSHAAQLSIDNYTFIWHVAKVGNVSFEIVKETNRTGVLLGSFGGKVSQLFISPAEGKAIAEALLKSEEYYEKYKKRVDGESSDSIKAGTFRVTFSSEESGRNFMVQIAEQKLFSLAVSLKKDEVADIANYLMKAEEMAAFVDKRIKP